MRFQFEYLNQANKGLKVEFDQDNLSVGRKDENDFAVDNAFVSGVHARIYSSGNQLMIEDLDSTNGTFINKKRLKAPAALRPGDVIQLGTEIKLRYTPLISDFDDRTVIGAPEDFPDYQPPDSQQHYKPPKSQPPSPARPSMPAAPPPRKKRFPIWVIFVVGGVLILCVGAVLLAGGGAFLLNLFNLSGPATDSAGEVAVQQTQFAMDQTRAAMADGQPVSTEAAAPPDSQPPEQQAATPTLNLQATETAQAEAAIWAASNATGTVQAEGTAAAIAQLWQYVQGNMIPEMLVYGPGSGTIVQEDVDGVQGVLAGVSMLNGVVTVDFYPPYSRDEAEWDVAIFFRDLGKNNEYRVVIDSTGNFRAINRVDDKDNYLVDIYIDNINLGPDQANRMVLLMNGDRGACFVNGVYVAEFDISSRMQPGDIAVITHINPAYLIPGTEVQYENFKIYQLVQ